MVNVLARSMLLGTNVTNVKLVIPIILLVTNVRLVTLDILIVSNVLAMKMAVRV